MKAQKFKVPLRRIPSDDCLVTIKDGNGQRKVAVHAGEWVEVLPIASVAELLTLSGLRQKDVLSEDLAAKGFRGMIDHLAKRLVNWNWTDLTSQPLPCPYGKPEVLKLLSIEELLWLVANSMGTETQAERKNG